MSWLQDLSETFRGLASRYYGVADEIDHIVPVSKGGGNEASNLQVLCQECNRAKTDTVPGDR